MSEVPVARQKSKAKPELLRWARESARLDIAAAAQRADVKPEALESWEAGKDAPSIPQLRKLADVYKRPLVVFYLPRPPKDFDALRDFRRLPADAPEETPELALEIRWAHEMREVAVEVYALLEEPIVPFDFTAKLTEAPAAVAERMRKKLGLQPQSIFEVADWYDAYRARRAALEAAGALCFQVTGVDVAEARGFSINLRPLPVVAVNAADAVAARMFTLIHEAVHLALGTSGTCDLHSRGTEDRDQIEMFCNAVAAEVLVPSHGLKREAAVANITGAIDWPDVVVRELATRYKVSREVIVRRFLELGLATQQYYRAKRDEYRVADVPPDGSGGNFYNNRRVKYGMPLIRGVMDAYEAGKITANEAAAYLRVKVESLRGLVEP